MGSYDSQLTYNDSVQGQKLHEVVLSEASDPTF